MPTGASPPRPILLVVVVALVALEAGLLLGLAGVSLLTGVTGDGPPGLTLATAALAAIIAGFLGLSARGLWLGRRWARGPVLTWQLLQAAVSASELARAGGWVAAVLIALSAVVVAGLLSPAVTRATASTADPPVT